MAREPQFNWDPESGVAICALTDGYNMFIGTAACAEEDIDMMSEKTGCQIALWRAEIKYYTHIRDNELKPALKALKHVYYTMNRSKHFNSKSYENIMLWRQIRQKENDLATINYMIADQKKQLKEYIDEKDKFYKRVRANRKTDSVGQN